MDPGPSKAQHGPAGRALAWPGFPNGYNSRWVPGLALPNPTVIIPVEGKGGGYLQFFFADNPHKTTPTTFIAVGGICDFFANTPQQVYGWFGDFFAKKIAKKYSSSLL